jgi:hypothetical protein
MPAQAWLASMPDRCFSYELLIAEEYVSAVLTQVRPCFSGPHTCPACGLGKAARGVGSRMPPPVNPVTRAVQRCAAVALLPHPLQVAEEPAHAQVIHELLVDAQGTELYMQRPATYSLGLAVTSSGGSASSSRLSKRPRFSDLAEAARLLGHTALGYRRADGRIALVPNLDDGVLLEEGTKVIAMAETLGS